VEAGDELFETTERVD